MSRKILLFVTALAAVSLLLLMFNPVLLAQEEGLFSDSFDEGVLEGYEHSQDVIISGGVLKIEPGNFIFRQGAWEYPSFSLKFRTGQPSILIVNYHASDKGVYEIHIASEGESNELVLVKNQQGEGAELGSAAGQGFKSGDWNDLSVSFDGRNHEIALNGQTLIEAADEEPLGGGGLGLIVPGENGVEIDDLALTAGTAMIPQGPEEEVPQEGVPQEERPPEEGMPEEERPPEAAEGTEADQEQAAALTEDTGWKGLMEQLFITGAQPIDFQTFLVNLALSALFAYILGLVYIYWGASLSNRRKFAANFIIITVTTTFIILVVRSSVALSLGLVGALSIVRFRAAIKEPEELAYLFLAIGLGIGLGDNQRLITTLAFAFAIVILGLLKLFRRSRADANMHLNITTFPPSKIGLKDVQDALKPYCPKIRLLRFDENDRLLEMSFLVEFKKLDDLGAAREALQRLSDKIDITFLDNKGVW